MAKCGWCGTRELQTVSSRNGDGKGLETHTLKNSRKVCEGPGTSPYAGRITSRGPRS